MKSYRQIYKKLPAEFIKTVSNQYSANELDKILGGYMSKRPVTLRVNTLKTDVRSVMDIFRKDNIKFERVLWYDDALIIRNKDEKDLQKHKLYIEGDVYLQSLSSMIPPLVLKPEPGFKVLDLTAAPGGKTTQLAGLMKNKGFILANEINKIRAERMQFNLDRQGTKIAEVRVGDGKKPDEKWTDYFDAVLLDAPCSGTGTFLADNSQTYRGWTTKTMQKLVKEQRKLIESAVNSLKHGGVMVYSTCSILKEENEENVNWALENFNGSLVQDNISLRLEGAGVDCRYKGIGECKEGMMLLFPTELYEGFFISRFRKL